MSIHLKRVYDEPSDSDGRRVLVDRLWPRGLTKDKAKLDLWLKEIAPSDELRKWFHHEPEKWEELLDRYARELDERSELVDSLLKQTREQKVTLLYAARDTRHNNAVALKHYLDRRS